MSEKKEVAICIEKVVKDYPGRLAQHGGWGQ
jgi:hypothetical protein